MHVQCFSQSRSRLRKNEVQISCDVQFRVGRNGQLMSRNLARQTSRDLHSDCFALVLTAGFYCDSWAHNVRKVRVVKYIVVSGQIKAANQKYCHNRKWRRKLKETIFRTRGFGDNLHDFWRRYCRAKVLDLSRVVEAHLQTELTPNCFNVRRKNMLFQWTKKLRRELKIRLCT